MTLLVFTFLSACLFGCATNQDNSSREVHNHNWGQATYKWVDDYSSCTATRICLTDTSHVESETANSTYEVISSPICANNGTGRYSVSFQNEAFKTQTQDVVIDAPGHNWGEITYTWSEDYTTCTAERTCQTDSSHKETETVESDYVVIDNPTYTEAGTGKYIATFENPIFEEQTHEVTLTKLDTLVFTKNETYYSVKAHSTSIPGDIVIPSSYEGLPVTVVEETAFMNCSEITSVQLPDTIASIGKYAFANCTKLVSINIPGSVNGLYEATFYKCTSLTDITIGEGVGFIGTRTGMGCFRECTSLANISLPNSVSLIGNYAFLNCTSLRKVSYPDNDIEVSFGAFMSCESLRSLPKRVSEIDTMAFAACNSLTEVVVPNAYIPGSNVFAACKSIKTVTFAEGITTLPSNIFSDCTSLTQVTISSTVTSMGEFPFVGCTQLHEVINKSALELKKTDECFVLCDNLEAIITSDSYSKLSVLEGIISYIKTDGNILFVDYNNKNCTSLTIPSYITEIGNAALYNFDQLATINYEGTMEQWETMTKGNDWNHGVPATMVHCTNGDVSL